MIDKINNVIILLASYNGESYIARQIESIIDQDHEKWKLIISDDCSQDSTFTICKYYEEIDKRISVVKQQKNLGLLGNFSKLIQFARKYHDEKYFMFSDQDDIWNRDKISSCLAVLKMKNGEIPILLYTSKQYVDNDLNKLNIKITGEEGINLGKLLHQNMAYGCTMLFNDKLCHILDDIPNGFTAHDHYVALMAYFFGEIIFYPNKTLLYRQHMYNASGNIYRSLFAKICERENIQENINLFFFVVSFCHIHMEYLSIKDKKMIMNIYNRIRKNSVFLLSSMFAYGIKKNAFFSNLNFYIEIFILVIYKNIKRVFAGKIIGN